MSNIFDYLKIQGFRGLKSLELSGLEQVNILVGDNNSGKTSVLEAISIFCNPLDPLQWMGTSQRRSSVGRNRLPSRPSTFDPMKWIFSQENKLTSIDEAYQGEITIEAKGNIPIIKTEAKLLEIYGSGIETPTSRRLSDDDNILDDDNTLNEYIKCGLELGVIVTPVMAQGDLFGSPDSTIKESFQFWYGERIVLKKRPTLYIRSVTIYPAYSATESLPYLLTKIFESDKKEEILRILRLFDNNFIDIEILSTRTTTATIGIRHQILGLTPLYIFGDGLNRALIMAITLLSIENGILLIDEIETSIHVSALSEIFSWLVKTCQIRGIQLFVTTHSLEAIDAMLEAINDIDDIVGFKLNKEGLPPQRLSGDILDGLRERGLDVRGK